MRAACAFLLLLAVCNALNILVHIPKNAVSHVRTMGRIADVLAQAGHNVTTVMPLWDKDLKTEGTSLSHMIYLPALPEMQEFSEQFKSTLMQSTWVENNENPFQMLQFLSKMRSVMKAQCAANLATDIVDRLKAVHFDIAITEPLDMCAYTIFYLTGVPHLSALTTGLGEGLNIGLPSLQTTSYVPGVMSTFSDRMSFKERTLNLVHYFANKMMGTVFLNDHDDFHREQGLDIPSLWDILPESAMLFVNAEPLVDFPKPTLHKIVNIGGISVPPKSTKKLDKEWEDVMSQRPHTVLVSFGSVALSHLMPETFKESLCTVFRRFPNVTFIWKYEKQEHNVAAGIENVVTSAWMPQQELLADPRMSLFVTHGGAGSTNEAMMNGVPVVAIPVFADQMRNGRMLERVKSGVLLEKNDLANPDKVTEAIRTVLENGSYLKNARKTERMLREQPFSPEEKLVKNVEFAAKYYPLKQLDPYGRHLSFIHFYSIDVISFLALVAVVTVSVSILIIRCVLKRCMIHKAKTE